MKSNKSACTKVGKLHGTFQLRQQISNMLSRKMNLRSSLESITYCTNIQIVVDMIQCFDYIDISSISINSIVSISD